MILYNDKTYSPPVSGYSDFEEPQSDGGASKRCFMMTETEWSTEEENWEGCCEDPLDDDYYDRTVNGENEDEY